MVLVRYLLDNGTSLECIPELWNSESAKPTIALHIAGRFGTLKMVSMMLRYNIDIDMLDKNNFGVRTALGYAAECRSSGILGFLLRAGAYTEHTSEGLVSPFFLAAFTGRPENSRVLQQYGDNVGRKYLLHDCVYGIGA